MSDLNFVVSLQCIMYNFSYITHILYLPAPLIDLNVFHIIVLMMMMMMMMMRSSFK